MAGTRPECIKLAPVVALLGRHAYFRCVVVNSGQHYNAVAGTFDQFGIVCDRSLPSAKPCRSLLEAVQNLRRRLRSLLATEHPDLVLVLGDTSTAYAGARAAVDTVINVAHIEAGLRTDSGVDPFPEEWFRRAIAPLSAWHFAPTLRAAENLLNEGYDPTTIYCVGNTGIDCLKEVLGEMRLNPGRSIKVEKGLVLLTLHRRENWDEPCDLICDAVLRLTQEHSSIRVICPVHPNPRIARVLRKRLAVSPALHLVEPMNYREFIACALRAELIISDSGGIQEEAPYLGVPLLVPRRNTERPESIASGFARLVTIDRGAIVSQALELLAAPRGAPIAFDENAPFGAGNAAERIVAVLEERLLGPLATRAVVRARAKATPTAATEVAVASPLLWSYGTTKHL